MAGRVVGDAVREVRPDVLDAFVRDEELRELEDARSQHRTELANHPGARRGRRHHRIEALEDAFEARREPQRLVAVAAVRVELAAARLLVRKLDFVPEPLEHVHDGLRRLREERVAEAGDEEADSQELYRGERDAAVDLDDVKTASGDDPGGDAERRL